ncbi:MAG: hypothetical protein AAGC60_00185 [Acidobacteriota bacterium]
MDPEQIEELIMWQPHAAYDAARAALVDDSAGEPLRRRLALFGSACRATGRLRQAGTSLAAAGNLTAGRADEERDLLIRFASLRLAKGDYERAVVLARRAVLRGALDENRRLVDLGGVLLYASRPKEAIEATEMSKPDGFPRRYSIVRTFNLIAAHARLGNTHEATSRLAAAQREIPSDEHLDRARLSWLVGSILATADALEGAEEAVSTAIDSFLEAGFPIDSALAATDLAAILVASGRQKSLSTAAWAFRLLGRLGADSYARRVLISLMNLADRGRLDTAAIQETRDRLEILKR